MLGRTGFTFIGCAAALLGTACASPSREPDIARLVGPIVGGAAATDAFYDAVGCMPRNHDPDAWVVDPETRVGACEPGSILPGWDHCYGRCEINATLITPNIIVADAGRIFDQDGTWQYAYKTALEDRPVHQLWTTSWEVGFGPRTMEDGPVIKRYAVMAYEQRLHGIAPYCRHLIYDDDPTSGKRNRYYYPASEAEWDDPLPSAILPSDPAFYLAEGGCGGAGVDSETECAALDNANCEWRPAGDSHDCIHISHDVGGSLFDTYREYATACAAPIAPDDAVVGSHVFFLLSERMDEADITPIPLGLRFPDGTTNQNGLIERLGDIVGHGDSETENGVRRVALASTALSYLPAGDHYDASNTVYPADGSSVVARHLLAGDGTANGGAGHVDWAAPLMLEAQGQRRAFAFNITGIWAFDGVYSVPLSDQSAPILEDFLDPDGDGFHRGFIDAILPSGAPRPGYIDADGDGLSEYRVVSGTPGIDGCVEAYPPVAGQCWMPTRNDNCGPVPGERPIYDYTNPNQLDRDGDGIGDVCDVCPVAWDADQASCIAGRDLTAAESPSGRSIRRGQPVGLLCATRLNAADPDGDGFLDAFCDNCPGVANDQTDTDGDGVGDACDICPEVFNPAQDGTDDDGDGVPEECDNCPAWRCDEPDLCQNDDQADGDMDGIGNVCDNCDTVPNRDQANCNEDSERAQGLWPRVGDACDDTWCPQFDLGQAPDASRFGPSGRASTASFTGYPLFGVPQDVRTGFRFCACDTREDTVAARVECARFDEPGDPGCVLDDFARYDEPEDLQWRTPQFLGVIDPVYEEYETWPEPFLRYAPPGPSALRFTAVWDFPADMSGWGVPVQNIGGLIERSRGVVWGHALTNVAGEDRNRALTSHYWSGEMERLDGLNLPELDEIDHVIVPRLPPEICSVCVNAFPLPRLWRCDGDLCIRFADYYEPAGGPTWQWVQGLDMSLAPLLDGRVAPALYTAMASDPSIRWVNASEPVEHLTGSATHFVGLNLGGEVTIAAGVDTGVLVNTMAVSAALAYEPTEDSVLVLSGRAHILYQVQPGSVVEWVHLPTGSRGPVALSSPLGQVRAATLLAGPARRLLAVDVLGGSHRVLRIDLASGSVVVLAAYSGTPPKSFELATLPDGRVAITSREPEGERLGVVLLDADDDLLETQGWEFGVSSGSVGGSLSASAQGISYVLSTSGMSGWYASGARLEELDWVGSPHTLGWLEWVVFN